MSRLSPGRPDETYQAFETLEEGYLVRWAGIDPDTDEPWKPTWVLKRDCGEELIARWELNKQFNDKSHSGSLSTTNADTREVKAEPREFILSDCSVDSRDQSTTGVDDPRESYKRPFTGVPVKVEVDSQDSFGPEHLSKRPRFTTPHNQTSSYPRSRQKRGRNNRRTSHRHDSMRSFSVPEPETATSRATEEPTDTPFEITDAWLLHSSLAVNGMTVEIKGSFGDYESGAAGFASGDYEGMHGVILSVHNVGGDPHASTGRVKLQGMPQGLTDIYVIPVAYLWPVPPSSLGDKATVLHGTRRGLLVKLYEKLGPEDTDASGWYVSSEDKSHQFEVESSWLVGIVDVAE